VGVARRRGALQSGSTKPNALVRDSWDPLRFTWHDLDGRPVDVLGEIQDTLVAALDHRSRCQSRTGAAFAPAAAIT
jgi:hypothetical protein